MLTRRRLLVRLAYGAAPAVLLAQDVRFSTGVRVVSVLATVSDPAGRVVTDLTRDDFTIEDEGSPVPIQYFSRQTDPPLLLGLLVDSSGSVRGQLGDEIKAARKFLRQILRADLDQAIVIRFESSVELMADRTSSLQVLGDSLDRIDGRGHGRQLGFQTNFQDPGQLPARPRFSFPGPAAPVTIPGPAPRVIPREDAQASTRLYDAIYLGAGEMRGSEAGRKALILTSDGLDGGSKVSLDAAIEEAQRADALIYSIRFADNDRAREIPAPALERAARETGGVYFEAGSQSLDGIFAGIQAELHNQYSLGFAPAPGPAGYRRIHVTVNRPGFTARAREGYYLDP